MFVKKCVDCPLYGEIVLNNKGKCFQRIIDDYVNKNKTEHNKIGHIFLVSHTEYL